MVNRASRAGFTLLELTLALAVSLAFLTAFMVGYRTLMGAMNTVATEVGGVSAAAEALDVMTRDLDQATSIGTRNDTTLQMVNVFGDTIAYRVVALDAASQDIVIERALNGASASLGPRRLLANLNPYHQDYRDITGTLQGPGIPVPVFRYSLDPNHTPVVDVFFVLQANSSEPVRYLRATSVPRSMDAIW